MIFISALLLILVSSTTIDTSGAFTPIYHHHSLRRDLVCVRGCRTPSVTRVAEKTVEAANAIKMLEDDMQLKTKNYEDQFNVRRDQSLKEAGVNDKVLYTEEKNIQVQRTTEFSIDAITNVLVKVLKSVQENITPGVNTTINTALTPDSIATYTDVVNSVAQACQSSSESSSAFSYSMTKMGPGVFAFLSATSTKLKDEETFGKESIIATSFLYQLCTSENDVKRSANFNILLTEKLTKQKRAILDEAMVIQWKNAQSGLIDTLVNGGSVAEFTFRDNLYQKLADQAMERAAKNRYDPADLVTTALFSVSRNHKDLSLKEMQADIDGENLKRIKSVRSTVDNSTAKALDSVTAKIAERLSGSMYGQALLDA